ncbi:MAG: HU family DNA-binding protein [Desulfovibrionaceae bacterium]|nr:HU family DNA-binding protein [Desulfovibrionaceae bacterium]
MTKAELVAIIAAKANMTKAGAERAINALLEAAHDALKKDDKVTLTGFGTFAVEQRKARKGRNPRTGEEIDIPAAKIVKFRAGKDLKDSFK